MNNEKQQATSILYEARDQAARTAGKGGRAMIHDKLYKDMASSHPALERGLVRCRHCGASRHVDSARCLREGWPECHGETMELVTGPIEAARK